MVSVGTREALDALREEQRQSEAALAQVLMEGIKSLQEALARGRDADRAERESLASALKGLQDGVDMALERCTPPPHDEARPGRRSRWLLGGGER